MRSPVPAVLVVLVLEASACTSDQPASPAPPATPAIPATPALAAPTVPAEPATPEPIIPPPSSACDLTGTWRLKVVTGRDDCGELKDESIELALAAGPANTVVGAARVAGEAGALGVLLPALRVAPYAGPDTTCGLRIEIGGATTPRGELLLARSETGLDGQSSLWATRDDAVCRHSSSVFGERIAAAPAPWAALTAAGQWPQLTATPASPALSAAVRKLAARAVFTTPAKRPAVKLRGSIVEFVAAVAEQPRAVQLFEVPCTTAAAGPCVAIVGDPCRPAEAEGEDCEGMYLTVVVDTAAGKLDRADSGGNPVTSHADIEQRLADAP